MIIEIALGMVLGSILIVLLPIISLTFAGVVVLGIEKVLRVFRGTKILLGLK